MRLRSLRSVILCAVVLCASNLCATVQIGINLHIQQYGDVPFYYFTFSPASSPFNSDGAFVSAQITSQDGEYLSHTEGAGGWTFGYPLFNSFSDLLTSLQQPFHLTLDQGLASERNYTTSVTLGSLLSVNLTPPSIQYPLQQSTIDTFNPTFLFTLPSAHEWIAQLQTIPIVGSGTTPAQTPLAFPAGSWTPGVTLQTGVQYYLDIYTVDNIRIDGFGFSTPLDDANAPLPDWSTSGLIEFDVAADFMAVPEPDALLMGGTCVSMLAAFKIARRDRRY
jgi:hypothetical protein